ncbi:MAG: glycosyltransferase [Candidatus Woesearchaeota archaeon]
MINIVLMAGNGKRFVDAGYKLSKPMIPVSGKPMILQAIESMPDADKWVFVMRKEHLENAELARALRSISKNVKLMKDSNPIGQLNSCLIAKQHFPENEPFFVGACDMGMEYDKYSFEKLMISENAPEMVVFSFTKQPNLTRNPSAWGWLRQDESKIIKEVSVKIPISENPFNDFAITGSFAFKNGKIFMRLSEKLIKRSQTVKGEYYIDSMINIANELGYKVVSFPVKYIGWGTPTDYEEYNYWEKAISNPSNYPELLNKKEYIFWKEYFESKKKPELSIIVPCYNEEMNIPLVLDRFARTLQGRKNIELILVDNNSKDNSAQILVDSLKQEEYSFARTVFQPLPGYGAAIWKGLTSAKGEFICWTHADMQTDPEDTITAFNLIKRHENPVKAYIKGERHGRPLFDSLFTSGMSLFETVLLRKRLYDINAQPNLFHRSFLDYLANPPSDFSFDLYCYYIARKKKYEMIRFPVLFTDRLNGHSNWNNGVRSKIKFIKRTIDFSIGLLNNQDIR